MSPQRTTILSLALAATVGALTTGSQAELIGPEYPPPGGVTFSRVGDLTRGTGETFTFLDFDLCETELLYWAPQASSIKIAFEGDTNGDGDPFEGSEILAFAAGESNLEGGVGVWTGSSVARFMWGGNYQSFNMSTRFTLTVTESDGTTAIALTAAADVGLDGVGAAVAVQGDFDANLMMEVEWLGTWYPVNEWFDSVNQDPNPLYGECRINFAGGFYYEVLATDCNDNDRHDSCDIDEGTSPDINGNDVPDECECVADTNGDTVVNVVDLVSVVVTWGPCPDPCMTDINKDGEVNVLDLLQVVLNWGGC